MDPVTEAQLSLDFPRKHDYNLIDGSSIRLLLRPKVSGKRHESALAFL